MNNILPGLTVEGASLLTQLAMRGLQAINQEAQAAGAAVEAAIAAAQQPPAPDDAAQPQKDAP